MFHEWEELLVMLRKLGQDTAGRVPGDDSAHVYESIWIDYYSLLMSSNYYYYYYCCDDIVCQCWMEYYYNFIIVNLSL